MTSPAHLKGVHHVAYRCKDAKETVEFYRDALGMDFQLAIAEDHVPSTGAYDPYMHIFLDAGNGNVLAFFELPQQPEMGRDENTPAWVQHIAFRVGSLEELLATKAHLEGMGLDVLGPTHHASSNRSISSTQWPPHRACRRHRHAGADGATEIRC